MSDDEKNLPAKRPRYGQVSRNSTELSRRPGFFTSKIQRYEAEEALKYEKVQTERYRNAVDASAAKSDLQNATHRLNTIEQEFKIVDAQRDQDLSETRLAIDKAEAEADTVIGEFEAVQAAHEAQKEEGLLRAAQARQKRAQLEGAAVVDSAAVERLEAKQLEVMGEIEELQAELDALLMDDNDPAAAGKTRLLRNRMRLADEKLQRIRHQLDQAAGLG